ncbi:hypothetical protein [Micromonospora sp. WMMD1155]|uniref:hypothetical protein n=1 Tax=Micromonospora sp. WMMD1155 TaxID=3016094 RepID=UPI00249C75B4|nr:hypothetical protein [Micromonospora sp. WMMD1155]WFE51231.1 hypothetical protein O7617_13240 [Micromonospora sp. WMMD1155]
MSIMDAGPDLIPLAEGVATFGGGNAYSWYRSQAHRGGTVSMGGQRVPVVKVSSRWMISKAGVAQAVEAERRARAEIVQWTADYAAGVLREGLVQLTGGRSYTVRGPFHLLTVPQPIAPADSWWICNSCRQLATTRHDPDRECHRCRDWSPCADDCTLVSVSCPSCRTSLTLRSA